MLYARRVIYCAGKLEGIYDNKEQEAAAPLSSRYYRPPVSLDAPGSLISTD